MFVISTNKAQTVFVVQFKYRSILFALFRGHASHRFLRLLSIILIDFFSIGKHKPFGHFNFFNGGVNYFGIAVKVLAQPEPIVLLPSPDAVACARSGSKFIKGLLDGVNGGVLVDLLEVLSPHPFVLGLWLAPLISMVKPDFTVVFTFARARLRIVAILL